MKPIFKILAIMGIVLLAVLSAINWRYGVFFLILLAIVGSLLSWKLGISFFRTCGWYPNVDKINETELKKMEREAHRMEQEAMRLSSGPRNNVRHAP